MVIEADDPRYFPGAIFQLPHVDELCFPVISGVIGMRKPVHADLDSAIPLQRIDLERSGQEFPVHLAADVVFDRVEQVLAAECETRLVVIELQVVREEGAQLVELAAVVGVEHGNVESSNGLVELVGRGQALLRLGQGESGADDELRSKQKNRTQSLHRRVNLAGWGIRSLTSTDSARAQFLKAAADSSLFLRSRFSQVLLPGHPVKYAPAPAESFRSPRPCPLRSSYPLHCARRTRGGRCPARQKSRCWEATGAHRGSRDCRDAPRVRESPAQYYARFCA